MQSPITIVPGAVSSGDAVVYEYGLRLDKASIDLVGQQIVQSRRLYNDLVAAIRETVTAAQAFVIERAGGEAQQLQSDIDALTTAFKAARAGDDEPAMKAIAQERREKWAILANILKGVRKAHRVEIQDRFLSKIGKNSSCLTYLLRSKAVTEGLGWGTANAVLDAALQAFKTSFALGKAPRFAIGAEIDQDCLTAQFTTAGGASSEAILAGRQSDLVLLPTNGCGRRKYGEFKFRLGAAKANQYATGTWQYHRPLPDGSHIALARLVRRRIGMHYRWAIQLLVKPKEPVRVDVGERKPLAAVHFGWAADISGRRVAAISDGADPGAARLVSLPTSIEEGLNRAAEIQSGRDTIRDEIAVKARQIEVPEAAPDELHDLLGRLRKTRPQDISANRLHYLCRLLRDSAILPDWLNAWRKEDRLRWQDQTHIARRARNARKTFYRGQAIRLAEEFDAIAIEPLDLAKAAQKVDDMTGEKSEFATKARAGRVVAALYEFESAIRWAATKAGSALLEVSGSTASICGICGGTAHAALDDHQTLICHECGAVLDRKQNGAAIAWCYANEHREIAVTDFWSALVGNNQERQAKKAERLQKMAAGRRNARTTRAADEASGGSA